MPLHIATLGQLSIQRDGSVLSGSGTQPRRLALLALLARAGEKGVSREKAMARTSFRCPCRVLMRWRFSKSQSRME